MREILFRGKCIDDGKWVYGLLSEIDEAVKQAQIDYDDNEGMTGDIVDLTTVGQYTGLTDKNGKKIFEGDILKVFYYGKSKIFGVVKFGETRFFIDDNFMGGDIKSKAPMSDMFSKYDFEVVGNIYDNPELLKGGAQ